MGSSLGRANYFFLFYGRLMGRQLGGDDNNVWVNS